MGSFTFKWPHDAEEVYVTGTFDNWTKSQRLELVGDVFQKTVTLPAPSTKIFYKFVVDGRWTIDPTAPQEKDHEGNDNNVLLPEQMDALEEASQAALINNLVPASTTAQLAGAVPLEAKKEEKQEDKQEEKPSDAAVLSSAAPESTTAQLAAVVPLEEEKKDDPSLPGGYPETPANELSKEVSVNPLPAADGAINPIKLAPGEEVPKDVSAGGVNSHVTLDKESYEQSDRIPGLETTLPHVTKNLIPESSLPITGANDVHISSAAPESTSATLAGQVPLEPKVPEVVKKSQEDAKVEPEASAISEEVKEKAAVEDELLQKVPEAPSTFEGTAGKGTEKSETDKTTAEQVLAAATSAGEVALGAAITAGGAAAVAATKAGGVAADTATDAANKAVPVATDIANKASDTATDLAAKASDTATDLAAKTQAAVSEAATHLPDAVKGVLGQPTTEDIAKEQQAAAVDSVSPEVPAEVKESIKEAGVSPEATVNTEAVVKKEDVEAELLDKVKTDAVNASISPEVPAEVKDSIAQAGASPEAAANTTAVENKDEVESELLSKVKAGGISESVSSEVPAEVKQSIEAAGAKPEAAAITDAVEKKEEVEAELLDKVKTTEAVGESSTKAAEESKPQAVEPPQSAVAVKTVDEAKPAETAVAVEPPQPAEPVKATDEAAPAESTKAADAPQPAAAPTETAKASEAQPVSNGATTAAASSTTTDKGAAAQEGSATSEKKKKHRISGFFNKLKHKFQ